MAAKTKETELAAVNNNNVIPNRISSISDLNSALNNNGSITGNVFYFGHLGGHYPRGSRTPDYMIMAIGETSAVGSNLDYSNVNQVSNAHLSPNTTITLMACHGAYGGDGSIAQLLANQLGRTVLASPVGMHFSSDPTLRSFNGNLKSPATLPAYMIPDNGKPLVAVKPK